LFLALKLEEFAEHTCAAYEAKESKSEIPTL